MKKIVLSLALLTSLVMAQEQAKQTDRKVSKEKHTQVHVKAKRVSYHTKASSIHKKLHRKK